MKLEISNLEETYLWNNYKFNIPVSKIMVNELFRLNKTFIYIFKR